MARIVVCGGSVVGSATAMMLARDGHGVTVLEADPAPVPPSPERAWDAWSRTGVVQFRQPHILLARGRQVLDADLPGLTDALLDAGCVGYDPLASPPPALADRPPRPDDDRFRGIGGRRPVIEAVLARACAAAEGVTVRRGTTVRGLLDGTGGEVPHVRGVVLGDGSELPADLVVDATGRRSRLPGLLTGLGAARPRVQELDSGFVYHSRYFRSEQHPSLIGPPVAELGSFSVLTLPGDNDTWSVTVWTSAHDTGMRALRDPDVFAALLSACPLQARWLRGDPVTDVLMIGGILDRHRRFVVDDRPVATGILAVGDAWACTNPSAGRGMSIGLLHAQRLRAAVRGGLGDPDALVRRFDELTERDVSPYVHDQIAMDRARLAQMDALRSGAEQPDEDPADAALGAASAQDPEVFRALLEVIGCLAPTREAFSRPGIRDRVAAFAGQRRRPLPAPTREQVDALLGGGPAAGQVS